MKSEKLNRGLFDGPLADVLPSDLAYPALPASQGPIELLTHLNELNTLPHDGLAPAVDEMAIEVPRTILFPDIAGPARSGLETAAGHADTDLSVHAQVMTLWQSVAETSEDPVEPVVPGGAGAKPAWANNGDTSDGGSDTTTKGRGKTKDKPTDGGTDTGGTDTGSTDTGGTDTGGTNTGETNTGSGNPDNYVSGLDTPDGFNIEIAFSGTWTDAQKQGFYSASELISDIIQGDVATHNGIDDIFITATMTTIDGTGGYWGWGGVTTARSDSLLPSQGYMRFDIADADTVISYGYGMWENLIFHEMLHALGFGVSWNSMGLVEYLGDDLRFTGENAINAYNETFADIAAQDQFSFYGVPVETDGGSGTAGVHWDDATFGAEVMTGTIRWTDQVSDMTIAALEDMGYQTIYGDDLLVV